MGSITFTFDDQSTALFNLAIDGVHAHQVALAAIYLGEQAKLLIGAEIIDLMRRSQAAGGGLVVPVNFVPGQDRGSSEPVPFSRGPR